MKRTDKEKILKAMSENLKQFNPEYDNKFLCPVCMNLFDLKNLNEISEAHILPESTGNKLITWLCHDCNTKFGRKQDRWLGEYINIKKSKTYFNEKTTIQGIYLNRNKIYGEIIHDINGINIYIQEKNNSKETIKKINSIGHKINLEVKMPVLSKSNEISVGFITAAYLFCFNKFGYSWVFQNYLNSIRDIILENQYIKNQNVHISKITSENKFDILEFGFAIIDNDFLPMVKIYDQTIFFSPFYKKNLASYLANYEKEYNLTIKVAQGLLNKNYPKPFMLTIDDKMIMYPDLIQSNRIIEDLVLLESSNFETIFLRRTKNNIQERIDEKEDVKKFIIRMKEIEN